LFPLARIQIELGEQAEEEIVMSTVTAPVARSSSRDAWERRGPWTAIAFVVFFLASVVVSNPPDDSAPDARWLASYATSGKQASHLATGVFLILASLCLAGFLTHLWTRIARTRPSQTISPLPIVAAGIAAACMAVGGALMGVVGGDMLLGSSPLPGADLLRFCNDLGFVMVGVPGMLAAALSIACLGIQAHTAGIFGTRLRAFSLVVAVILLASLEFIPIAALLIWLLVVGIALLRGREARPHPRPSARQSTSGGGPTER
jgi:hypothetical protein